MATGIPSSTIVRCDSQQMTPTTITVVSGNPPTQTLIVQPMSSGNKQLVLHQVAGNPAAEILPLTPKSDGEDDSHGDVHSEDSSPQSHMVDATHFIVTDSDSGSEQVSHPTFVQYVENGSDQGAIYTNGQMAYPVYAVGEGSTMYTTGSNENQYFSSGNAPVTYTQEVTYIVDTPPNLPSKTEPHSPSDSTSLSNANKISPSTVQWLMENFETAEGVSLPRSSLYHHYNRHCNEHKLDPVNAASFGKLIRSVFVGLRTRRLGTRGNSKYHYYGIRVKPDSPLHHLPLVDENETPKNKKYKTTKNGDSTTSTQPPSQNNNNTSTPNHNFLGDGSNAIPDFPDIEFSEMNLPDDVSLDDVDTFRSIYREHCEAFLDAILTLDFNTVESLWREFWRAQNNNNDECEEEKYLSKHILFSLSKCIPVQSFVRRVDYLFYQNLVEVLIPDVLRPIPGSLTSSIRNFAKAVESWLTNAMQGCPEEIIDIKVTAVGAFAQMLRRYTSLNHLAQAARAVLQNSNQINQMLTDLNRVDFHNVQEQASWVCQCDSNLVQQLESDFKLTLQQQNSLEEWANWLKNVVNAVLKPFEGKPNFTKAARQFLLKWSFYSSMVIRDLTLRSAASFGSFHLIRLLYDEYMFYLIEHQVALATGETPIAVIGNRDQRNESIAGIDNDDYYMTTNGAGGNILDEELMGSSNKRMKLNP